MKITHYALILIAIITTSCQPKQSNSKNDTSSFIISDDSVFKETKSLVWNSILKDFEPDVIKECLIEETDSTYEYSIPGDIYSIPKKDYIKGDFDKDGSIDVIVPVDLAYGASSETTIFYLFLNIGHKPQFKGKFDVVDIASKQIKDNTVLESGHFMFYCVNNHVLEGSAVYAAPGDAHCCPSYYTEKEQYQYNPKTNSFDLIYQSEIKRNNSTE